MKKFITLTLMMLVSITMFADQLTPQEALARLGGSKVSAVKGVARVSAAGQLSLAYTSTSGDINSYYVFNNKQGGYVLLSADDCLPAVLGTVDDGEFNYDELPENMKWFLSSYDRAVENFSKAGKKASCITADAIKPLLENTRIGNIKWGQAEPYNILCPSYEDTHGVTGCVATAMAQVMAYHEWPKQGKGNHSYNSKMRVVLPDSSYILVPYTASADFENTIYDWDNMLEDYTVQEGNDAQKRAVATLMAHCGVAVDMVYGTDGSGTKSERICYGMMEYFKYDKNIHIAYHNSYTNNDWDRMIYNELASNGPVIFGSNNEVSVHGHEFVCDGFKDGLFHINWGWNGHLNNYFYITGNGMNPAVGIDENGNVPEYEERFDINRGYDLAAIVGIKPEDGIDSPYSLMSSPGYTVKADSTQLTIRGAINSNAYQQVTLWPALALIADNDTTIIPASSSQKLIPSQPFFLDPTRLNSPYGYIITIPDTLPSGTYSIAPYYSEDSLSWAPVTVYGECMVPKVVWNKDTKALSISTADFIDVDSEAVITLDRDVYEAFPATVQDDNEQIVVSISGEGIRNCGNYSINLGVLFVEKSSSVDKGITSDSCIVLEPNSSIKDMKIIVSSHLCDESEYHVIPIYWPSLYDSFSIATNNGMSGRIWNYVFLDENKEYPILKIKWISESTGITVVSAEVKSAHATTKVLRNGRIILQRPDGSHYTTAGQQVL